MVSLDLVWRSGLRPVVLPAVVSLALVGLLIVASSCGAPLTAAETLGQTLEHIRQKELAQAAEGFATRDVFDALMSEAQGYPVLFDGSVTMQDPSSAEARCYTGTSGFRIKQFKVHLAKSANGWKIVSFDVI